jgi:hypothetical protein
MSAFAQVRDPMQIDQWSRNVLTASRSNQELIAFVARQRCSKRVFEQIVS